MLRRILLAAAVLTAGCWSQSTRANDGLAYSGFPFGFGFYQPYGVRYSTSVRTPPYFATNPPVYYGQRHYRPYGASPFASLPLLEAGPDYRTRPAGEGAMRSLSIPHPSARQMNPFCAKTSEEETRIVSVEDVEPKQPLVYINPFAPSQVASENPLVASPLMAERQNGTK